jgi:hypothetical protein
MALFLAARIRVRIPANEKLRSNALFQVYPPGGGQSHLCQGHWTGPLPAFFSGARADSLPMHHPL